MLLHEAAHVRRRHLPIRMLVLLLPIATALVVQATCPGALDTTSRWLLAHGVPATWQGALLLPAAAATYLLVAMGTISRRLELDADRWVAQQGAGDALASALTKLAERDPHPDKATWLHPSLQSRIEAIVAQAASL